MKYAPGDEVYCVGYTGRWRVDTVSARGHPVLCTRLDDDMKPAMISRNLYTPVGGVIDEVAEDQVRMALNKIDDFSLCVVADMNKAQLVADVERGFPGLKIRVWE